ncbi:MAG: PorV/PorQ family protein [Candidatus Zixiibacteriota bacterium]
MTKYKIILLIALIPLLAFGQAKVGTAEGQFLEIGVSARGMAMAEAFTGTADDASAIFFNPSGVGRLTRREFMFTHIEYLAGINYEIGAFVMPIAATGGVAGLSVNSLNTGDMYETTPSHPEGTGRTFNAHCLATGLTYSQMLTDRFSAGLTWKYIHEQYADVGASTWAVDLGTMYRTEFKNLRIGMSIRNFGPDITFISDPAPLPMAFHLGFAGEVIDNEMHKLTLALETSHPNDNLEKFNFGTEYWWDDMVAIRAGVKAKPDSIASFAKLPAIDMHLIYYSFGAGVKIPVYLYTIKVDYAFTDRYWFKPEHRFTIGMEF